MSTSRLEIDLGAIERNFSLVRRIVGPSVGICAVLKQDAYGLGAPRIARRALACGAKSVAVYNLDEARTVFEAAPEATILVLMPVAGVERTDPLYRCAAAGRLHVVVHDSEQLVALNDGASRLGVTIPVHGRYGPEPRRRTGRGLGTDHRADRALVARATGRGHDTLRIAGRRCGVHGRAMAALCGSGDDGAWSGPERTRRACIQLVRDVPLARVPRDDGARRRVPLRHGGRRGVGRGTRAGGDGVCGGGAADGARAAVDEHRGACAGDPGGVAGGIRLDVARAAAIRRACDSHRAGAGRIRRWVPAVAGRRCKGRPRGSGLHGAALGSARHGGGTGRAGGEGSGVLCACGWTREHGSDHGRCDGRRRSIWRWVGRDALAGAEVELIGADPVSPTHLPALASAGHGRPRTAVPAVVGAGRRVPAQRAGNGGGGGAGAGAGGGRADVTSTRVRRWCRRCWKNSGAREFRPARACRVRPRRERARALADGRTS